jgi:hypothetical protein
MGKKKATRSHKKKEDKTPETGKEDLKIKWKNWLVTISSSGRLKHGRWYLYSAAIVDLLGVITIVIKSIKDTYWIWIVTSFALLLLLSIMFIAGVIMVVLIATPQES